MTMTPAEVLAEMRDRVATSSYVIPVASVDRWADELERAMREPVAYRVDEVDAAGNRAASSLSWTSVSHLDRPDLMPRNIPLYAAPLTESQLYSTIDRQLEAIRDADAEIERLKIERENTCLLCNRLEREVCAEGKVRLRVEIERLSNLLTECDGKLGRKPCQTGRCMEYIGLIGLAADNAGEIEQLTADLASVRQAARDFLATIDASPERTLLKAAIFE